MNILKMLKSKKGIAIENAIIFLIVIFMFCALLTSLTMYGHYHIKLNNILLLNRVTIEQIGEDFLADELETYENYNYEVKDNVLIVKSGENVILYVKKDDDGKLLTWRYSQPKA